MDSFPGGFPGLYDSDTGRPNQFDQNSRSSRFKRTSPELEAVKKSLKHRKRALKKHMIHNMDSSCYIFIFITYLYDCSLLLLLMRSFVQSVS